MVDTNEVLLNENSVVTTRSTTEPKTIANSEDTNDYDCVRTVEVQNPARAMCCAEKACTEGGGACARDDNTTDKSLSREESSSKPLCTTRRNDSPVRNRARTMSDIMLNETVVTRRSHLATKNLYDDCPTPSFSFLQSLPVSEAFPESAEKRPYLSVAKDVMPISCHFVTESKSYNCDGPQRPLMTHLKLETSDKIAPAPEEESLPYATATSVTAIVNEADLLIPHDDLPCITATELLSPRSLSASGEGSIEPAFISVMVYKPNRETELGITFSKQDRLLCITNITKEGLLLSSPLKGGLHLLSINGTKCHDWDTKTALNYLRDAIGYIHLVAQNANGNREFVQVYAQRTSRNVGISFKGLAGRQLRVYEIRPKGLFANSVLNEGDEVFEINGIHCPNYRPKDAVDIILEAKDAVTILAKTKPTNALVISTGKK